MIDIKRIFNSKKGQEGLSQSYNWIIMLVIGLLVIIGYMIWVGGIDLCMGGSIC